MKCSYFTGTGEKLSPDMSEVILNSVQKKKAMQWNKNLCGTRDQVGKLFMLL
jgi:hypothetical protein